MPSFSKPNFMEQLFAHNRNKERKRSRISLAEPLVNAEVCTRGPNSHGGRGNADSHHRGSNSNSIRHPIAMKEEPKETTTPPPPLRSRKRLQRILAYVNCHQQAMQEEPGYPVVTRQERFDDASTTGTTSTSRSTGFAVSSRLSTKPLDTWNECLPRLLLIVALNVQCNLFLETCPSYDQLRAQLLAERQKCRALLQKNAKITDRFLRFQQHVVSLRDQYVHLDQRQQHQQQQQLGEAAQLDRRPQPSITSNENRPAAGSHRQTTTLAIGPQSAFAPKLTHSRSLEGVRKSNPRRITASPARILQQLPRPLREESEGRRRTKVHQLADQSNRSTVGIVKETSRVRPDYRKPTPGAPAVASMSAPWQSPPNPIQRRAPTDSGLQRTASPVTPIATSALPAWVTESHQQAKRQSPDHLRPEGPRDDASQTIILPPLSISRQSCVALPIDSLPPIPSAPSSNDLSKSSVPPVPHDDSQTIMEFLPVQTSTSKTEPSSKQNSTSSKMPQLKDDTPQTGSGWMSTRPAKAFVAEVDNTKTRPLGSTLQTVPFKAQGVAHRVARLNQNQSKDTDDFLDSPSPKPKELPYLEVVRKKEERDRLQRFECQECGKFIQAICDQDSQGVYDRHALLCNSRHRARFTPPQTPDDFWELSFIDERDAKRRKTQDSSRAREPPVGQGLDRDGSDNQPNAKH